MNDLNNIFPVVNGNDLWASDPEVNVFVPVARPRLPSADRILSYLRRIDTNRWYSNGGPLVCEFEEKLAVCGGAPKTVSVSNATVGLTLALMAQGARPGTLCMLPAWSFAASAHAVVAAGLVPWFVDVEPGSWMLLPDHAANWLRDAPGEVGAVMPVMPFGQPMNLPSWDAFRELTGIPVVVDAAAAFDTARASKTPAVVSLHATKILGIGEGGFVMSTDRNLLDEVRKRTNFGFWNSREAAVVGLNAKLSEYAAAVGLAALDEWPQTRAAFERVANRYREAFAMTGILLQPNYGNGWMSSTTVVQLPPRTLNFVKLALAHQGISFRLWWGGGLHRHAAFIGFPRTPLPITDVLVSSVIGLPCWVDLPDHTIFHIAEIATKAVQQGM